MRRLNSSSARLNVTPSVVTGTSEASIAELTPVFVAQRQKTMVPTSLAHPLRSRIGLPARDFAVSQDCLLTLQRASDIRRQRVNPGVSPRSPHLQHGGDW